MVTDRAQMTSSADAFMRGTASPDGGEEDTVILVPKGGMRAVQIYMRCELTRVGMTGHCTGISATEVNSALEAAQEPRRRWPGLSALVQMMGRAAAGYINEQAEAARKRA